MSASLPLCCCRRAGRVLGQGPAEPLGTGEMLPAPSSGSWGSWRNRGGEEEQGPAPQHLEPSRWLAPSRGSQEPWGHPGRDLGAGMGSGKVGASLGRRVSGMRELPV